MKTTFVLGLIAVGLALRPASVAAHLLHSEEADHAVIFDEAYRAKLLAEFMGQREAPSQTSRQASALSASSAGGPASLLLFALNPNSPSQAYFQTDSTWTVLLQSTTPTTSTCLSCAAGQKQLSVLLHLLHSNL